MAMLCVAVYCFPVTDLSGLCSVILVTSVLTDQLWPSDYVSIFNLRMAEDPDPQTLCSILKYGIMEMIQNVSNTTCITPSLEPFS